MTMTDRRKVRTENTKRNVTKSEPERKNSYEKEIGGR